MPSIYEQERTLERQVAVAIHERLPEIEIIALEIVSPTRFCVYIDSPDGVDLGLCERVSHRLRGFNDRYSIDVSSPGVERPLRRPEHFAAVVGKPVAVRTAEKIDGSKNFRGQVLAADDDAVRLEANGSEAVLIPYDQIVRGNLIDEGSER